MKTTLIVMALNEIVGMKAIMPKIDRTWFDQILVVDGGSTDGTAKWAEENGYEVYVQKQKGIRQAYMEALPLVRGEVILTFSPDGNCIPELIPQMLEKMREGFDMVICSRYLGAAKSQDDDIVTAFGNWLFTATVNLLAGGKYTDCMGIYRIYKKKLIKELELDQDRWHTTPEKLFNCKISWEPLLSFRAARRGLRIDEIPGDEPARIGGERKLLILRWGASYYFQFLRDWLLWR